MEGTFHTHCLWSQRLHDTYKFEAFSCSSGYSEYKELGKWRVSPWLSQKKEPSDPESLPEADDVPSSSHPGPGDTGVRLVRVNLYSDPSLDMSEGTFRSALEAMRADPVAECLVRQNEDGFHQVEPKNSQYLATKFYGTDRFAVVWTFNPDASSTSVLLFTPPGEVFQDFCKLLTDYTEYHTAYFIAFVIALFQVQTFDKETREDHIPEVQKIEGYIGYAPNEGGGSSSVSTGSENIPHTIADMEKWSHQVKEVIVQLEFMFEFHSLAAGMLNELEEGRYISSERDRFVNETAKEKHRNSVEVLQEELPELNHQMYISYETQVYLKDRAEKLSSAIDTLINRKRTAGEAAPGETRPQ